MHIYRSRFRSRFCLCWSGPVWRGCDIPILYQTDVIGHPNRSFCGKQTKAMLLSCKRDVRSCGQKVRSCGHKVRQLDLCIKPGILQARFVHSIMEENIKSYMAIALSNCYRLLIWWKKAHLKTCPDLFHYSWINEENMTQSVNFPIWPVQYLACQTSQGMHKVTLNIVHEVHLV